MHVALLQIICISAAAQAATAPTRVHLSKLSQAPGLEAGLRLELRDDAEFVGSATRAEVLVEVTDRGQLLTVRDAQARPLVDRRVEQPGPAATRVFITLVAQAVRSYERGAIRTRTTTTTAPLAKTPSRTSSTAASIDPGISATPIAELPNAPEKGPASADLVRSSTAASVPWSFAAELSTQAWTRPWAPRLGGTVRSGLHLGAWALSFNLGVHSGPDLKTEDIEARLRALSLDMGGHRDVAQLGFAWISADLRAGLSLIWGRSQAAEPPYADSPLPSSIRLWQPYVQPGLTVQHSLSDQWTIYLGLSVRVALADHSLRLPSTFTDQPQTPIHTGWIRPGLALGLRAQVF